LDKINGWVKNVDYNKWRNAILPYPLPFPHFDHCVNVTDSRKIDSTVNTHFDVNNILYVRLYEKNKLSPMTNVLFSVYVIIRCDQWRRDTVFHEAVTSWPIGRWYPLVLGFGSLKLGYWSPKMTFWYPFYTFTLCWSAIEPGKTHNVIN